MDKNVNNFGHFQKKSIEQLDLKPFIKDGYDKEQVSAIHDALEKRIPIQPYLDLNLRGACIAEIAIGLEHHIDVTSYADTCYTWRKMIYSDTDYDIQISSSYGVAECIRQPFDDTLIKIKINNMVKLFQYQNELKETIRQQTERLKMQNRMLRIQADFLKKSNLNIIDLLGTMAEYRNLESSQHIQRVKTYTQIIADVYDALVNERVYKAAIPKEQAFLMIRNGECGTFSPELIQCLTNCREAMEAVIE